MGKYKFFSLFPKGIIDNSFLVHGRYLPHGNVPESVIFYGACINLESTVDAPITKSIYSQTCITNILNDQTSIVREIYAVAPITTQIYTESVKIVKKSKLR